MGGIGVILHLGAKARENPSIDIEDPEVLLKWLAKDRAMVTFAGVEEVRARTAALQGIVCQWIKFV